MQITAIQRKQVTKKQFLGTGLLFGSALLVPKVLADHVMAAPSLMTHISTSVVAFMGFIVIGTTVLFWQSATAQRYFKQKS